MQPYLKATTHFPSESNRYPGEKDQNHLLQRFNTVRHLGYGQSTCYKDMRHITGEAGFTRFKETISKHSRSSLGYMIVASVQYTPRADRYHVQCIHWHLGVFPGSGEYWATTSSIKETNRGIDVMPFFPTKPNNPKVCCAGEGYGYGLGYADDT